MPPFNYEEHNTNSLYKRHQSQYPQQINIESNSNSTRTRYKLQLQRMSFLTNDKNYIDHPENMKRLTKELERIEKEYKNVKLYKDPIKESFERILVSKEKTEPISISMNHSDQSSNDSEESSYSSSFEKLNFLSKWFSSSNEEPITSFKNQKSYHPTIINQMKQKRSNHNNNTHSYKRNI